VEDKKLFHANSVRASTHILSPPQAPAYYNRSKPFCVETMFYTVAQLRQIEQQALALGLPLMQRAGAAAAAFVAARTSGPVLVLVGPGNNGGDALVAATLLRRRGMAVDLVMPAGASRLPADAAAAWQDWCALGGTASTTLPARPYALLIDGLFGIGLSRPLADDGQALIDAANALALPTLALDVPSGIGADAGAALGRPIRANWTLAFIAPSRGLVTGAAVDAVGDWSVASLDLPPSLLAAVAVEDATMVASHTRLARPGDSHKGRFGTMLIVGGASGMVGAALLAGRAALQAGAGKVLVGLLDPNGPSVDFGRPELMLRPATLPLLREASVLAVGPGLGQSDAAFHLLQAALGCAAPLVLDADALNLIALHVGLRQSLQGRTATTVLTPHPSEAARLLGSDTLAVQADRYRAARQLADTLGATVVLKGAGTLIDDGRRTAVNRSGSAALANAGQGDVLSGLIAALLAQGVDAWQAAVLAVHVHGGASDALVAKDGRLVTLAGDVADACAPLLGRYRAS
jgi:hydroxyethylthiazole kinase-like uncharacterized protein yjeF